MPVSPRIAYCGPIARPGEPARGGYESANRRLIDDLRAHGLSVAEYPYAPERATPAGKAVAYASNFAGTAARVLAEAGRFDILHITPLRRHFILPEAVICMNANARGRKLVVDIRAGCFIDEMEGGAMGARVQARLLRHADLVTVEGLEYVDFARRFTDAPVHYLPNYVSRGPEGLAEHILTNPIRLVFLARIVPEKGIETAIEAVRVLKEGGLGVRLEVLGRASPDYAKRLDALAAGLPVAFKGAVNAEQVRETIRGAHFFIFPTRHDGEGHSNALTEAMAEGLVPLCADNGFNRSVVADCGRIFDREADGAIYATAVQEIAASGEWPELSRRTAERIARNYTAEAVVPGLIERYREIMEGGRKAA
jgi:glycosyltransferase involved in cell wall biosynthesis